MGSFMGHLVPGAILFGLGFWFNVAAFLKFYESRRKKTAFICTPTYRCRCACRGEKKYEIEGLVKIVLCFVGFLGELITGINACDGDFCLTNAHHITMYFFFGMTGAIDLLVYRQVPLPDNIQYCSFMIAIVVEGLLFKFHLHGRSDLDVHVHVLLVYAIAMCVLALAAEMRYRSQPMAVMARAWAFMLQGTWFVQVAFILYPPFSAHSSWKADSHKDVMLVTLIYAWHGAGNVLLMVLTALVVGCVKGSGSKETYRYHTVDDHGLKVNGHAPLSNKEDSELSDVEFQQSPA